jgi:hypothetical protein
MQLGHTIMVMLTVPDDDFDLLSGARKSMKDCSRCCAVLLDVTTSAKRRLLNLLRSGDSEEVACGNWWRGRGESRYVDLRAGEAREATPSGGVSSGVTNSWFVGQRPLTQEINCLGVPMARVLAGVGVMQSCYSHPSAYEWPWKQSTVPTKWLLH